MGMFSVDENINEYINNCTLAELNELSEIIATRKTAMRDAQKKELAVKLKEAFDAYSNFSFDADDLTVEIDITDTSGDENIYLVELTEAVITEENTVVFKACEIDLNDY